MGDPIAAAPDYGLDAPGVVRNLTIGGIACFFAGAVLSVVARPASSLLAYALLAWGLLAGASMIVVAILMTRSSRSGKLRERDALLDSLALAGNEIVLDLGCGRGLLAIGAAKRLPTGRVIAVDLWNPKDQKGANPDTISQNARLESVVDRIEIKTADMQQLPLPDSSVDVVVSSLAIHNIPTKDGRASAIREASRVLRPSGRLVILDFQDTDEYEATLNALGWSGVSRSALRWRMFPPVRIVSAAKPPARVGVA